MRTAISAQTCSCGIGSTCPRAKLCLHLSENSRLWEQQKFPEWIGGATNLLSH